AAAAEGIESLRKEALFRPRERFRLVGFGITAQLLPEAFVEGNAGKEFAGFGLHLIPCRAHGGQCRDCFQMAHNSHGVAERLGGLFERQHGVGEGSSRFVRRDRVYARLGGGEEMADSGTTCSGRTLSKGIANSM